MNAMIDGKFAALEDRATIVFKKPQKYTEKYPLAYLGIAL
jgi:hypothetical protein